jgi:hypothetical protein
MKTAVSAPEVGGPLGLREHRGSFDGVLRGSKKLDEKASGARTRAKGGWVYMGERGTGRAWLTLSDGQPGLNCCVYFLPGLAVARVRPRGCAGR